jgi:hypothetical protein
MTKAELTRVVTLEADAVAYLQRQPDGEFCIDTADHPTVSDRVFQELARRCHEAGWHVEWRGTALAIRLRRSNAS